MDKHMAGPNSPHDTEQTYHIKLEGMLRSPVILWDGDLTIITKPGDDMVKVCLILNSEAIRGFFNQFQSVNLALDSNSVIPKPLPEVSDSNDLSHLEKLWYLNKSEKNTAYQAIMED